jgi:hypothetical protein
MQVLGFLVSLLLDVRAHIPNQPSFGSGPTRVSYSTPLVRAVAAFLITTAFIATLIWLAVRLVIGFL